MGNIRLNNIQIAKYERRTNGEEKPSHDLKKKDLQNLALHKAVDQLWKLKQKVWYYKKYLEE